MATSDSGSCGLLAFCCLLAACSGERVEAGRGTQLGMDFASTALFAAPFPSDHRLKGGVVDVGGFPNPAKVSLVEKTLAMLHQRAEGFGTTSSMTFSVTAALDPQSLPSLVGSTAADASVYLIALDEDAPDAGERVPVRVAYRHRGGPFAPEHLLGILPLQGVPLRPGRRYAAVVTSAVRDVSGQPLARPQAIADLRNGDVPAGLGDEAHQRYRQALERLRALGVALDPIVGLAVFTTWDPQRGLHALVTAMHDEPLPQPLAAPVPHEVFDDYCVYELRYALPVYQHGTPPYLTTGGGLKLDSEGRPELARHEDARLFVTIPRRPMPSTGWPIAVMVRTGGGGDRPLVDRGPRATAGGEAITPGTGPALEFARAGWAGASLDGPHGGLRNVTGGDEQFLIFNIINPEALLENLRQSAAELTLLPKLLAALSLDVSACPGAVVPGGGAGRFDLTRLAMMGHSMGATIAPLALAEAPAYRAVVLSGAGGSWIENVLYKHRPLDVLPLALALLKYSGEMYRQDPYLNLLQWAGEIADPPVFGRRLVHEPGQEAPRHVLMLQGIVDHYILPSIANATSLSLGLDLAGPPLDAGTAELESFLPLASLLPLIGRSTLALPATGNLSSAAGKVTAVVVQHAEDGIEDGHEVAFQRAEARRQYRCFLQSFAATGLPSVPRAETDGACP